MDNNYICVNNTGLTRLTIGKTYTCIKYDESGIIGQILVVNDRDEQVTYKKERFVTVEEYRDMLLNNLLK